MSEEKEVYENQFLAFLNSKVGLFILSGLFLTLIPFLYTSIQDSKAERKSRKVNTTMLASEINHRLETVSTITNENLRPYQVQDIQMATFGMHEEFKPDYYSFRPIFKEFYDETLISLITRLNNLTTDETRQTVNIELINAVKKVRGHIDALKLPIANRKKVDMSGDRWTWEYNYQPNQKEQVQKEVIYVVDRWSEAWIKNGAVELD